MKEVGIHNTYTLNHSRIMARDASAVLANHINKIEMKIGIEIGSTYVYDPVEKPLQKAANS